VFERLDGRFSGAAAALPRRFANIRKLARYLSARHNDLQLPACELAPEILTVLSALQEQPGCLLARMSGSGATCFGLFEDAAEMAAAANAIARSLPGYWLAQTRF
jgi:4-diphosphocytidyl-2-C-methyl-D-erythritol kinase